MQSVPEAKASEVSFNEGILRLAAVHGRVVRFRYSVDDKSPIQLREFTPSEMKQSDAGALLAVGTDADRGGYRAYRLDRIKGEVVFA